MASPAKNKSTVEENQDIQAYKINPQLFESSSQVKDKQELVKKRIQKMEEHRAEVSEAVYIKVKADYEAQFESVREEFQEKCQEIQTELKKLYEAKDIQEKGRVKHQEVLEEAEFRNRLGEFDDEEFKKIAETQNKEIKKFQDLLDVIQDSISQYENILGQAFVEEVAPPPSPPPAPKPEAQAPAPEKAPVQNVPLPKKEQEEITGDTPLAPPAPPPSSKASTTTQTKSVELVEDTGLDDELDSFLQIEDDYFSDLEVAQAEAALEATQQPVEPSPPPVTPVKAPLPQQEDDSISRILKDMPMEDMEDLEEAMSTQEATGETPLLGDDSGLFPEASLLVLEGDLDDHEIILSENTSMGRSPSNDIVLKESKISRQHCTINFREGNFVIVDLKSANGILINNKKVEEAILKDGDEIRVGSFKFQFSLL